MALGCFQLSKRKDLLTKNSKLKVVQPSKVFNPLRCISPYCQVMATTAMPEDSHQNTNSYGRPLYVLCNNWTPFLSLDDTGKWIKYRCSSWTANILWSQHQGLQSSGILSARHFVFSKARVAPLKLLTLPSLKLMGATVAQHRYSMWSHPQCSARLTRFIHGVTAKLYHWLNSENNLKQFVANQVTAITKIGPFQWWGYWPSAKNPVDLLNRGVSLSSLQASNISGEAEAIYRSDKLFVEDTKRYYLAIQLTQYFVYRWIHISYLFYQTIVCY